MSRNEQVSELLDMIRVLHEAVRDGNVDAGDAADLCRAASELLGAVRTTLPKWWMRAAAQAASNALLEAALHLDSLGGS